MTNRKKTSLTAVVAVLLALTCAIPSAAEAQNSFNVPFSQFGIGLTELPYNMPYAYSMGGVVYSRASRNNINPFNPASYAAVEPESFVFDIGINIQRCRLVQEGSSLADADGNVAYLAVAFPLTKWWKTSAGLMPYSSVDYESVQTAYDAAAMGNIKTIYAGNGGVSQIYWGNGFNIGQRLSLGFNLNYLYGSITRAITYDFLENASTYFMNSRRQKDTYISNLVFDLGVQYRQPLGEQYTLNLGFTCRLPRQMTVKDDAKVYTYITSTSQELLCDTIFPLPGDDGIYRSDLEQPLALGAGLALERNHRWQVGVDLSYSPYSGMKYTENTQYNLFGTSAIQYHSNTRVALGGEWMGNTDAASYWSRIGIRAGVYYNQGRLSLEVADGAYRLDEIGGGLGFALPMRKGQSVLNLSVGYASFGTAELLRRDCLTIGLSLGSCEHWFAKRKYN